MQHRQLSVRVVGQRSGYKARTTLSPAVTVGAFTKAPKPRLKGTPEVGATLRVVRGTWRPKPRAWVYRWFADGRRIAGASESTLLVKPALRGKRIHVMVVASRDGFDTTRRRSAKTAPVS